MSALGPHPDPPTGFASMAPPFASKSVHREVREAAKGPWFRLHAGGLDALHFGRKRRFRFDDPSGKFGVLYVAVDEHGAFIETFGQSLRTSKPGLRFVSDLDLEGRVLARVRCRRRLRLVDLTGEGLSRMGADDRLCSGDYRVAQRWSRAIYAHPSHADGILYRARHDPSRFSAAIFDRARASLHVSPLGSFMDPENRSLRDRILSTYHVGLLLLPR